MGAAVERRSINDLRPIKVMVIGAGVSGIIAGIRFPQRIPNLDLVIYDKNPDVGGTWFENRYPGIACDARTDIPAHSYQLTFEPNPRWPEFYASGRDIHNYWKGVAAKYGVNKYVKLNTKVIEARFDESASKWYVKLCRTDSGEIFEDTADVLYNCIGALNEWKWPQIKGLHDFKGELLHSANWDENWDPTNKTVAVIGSGSSAIQIVPCLQPKVKRLDNYVRGRTWISPPFAPSEVEKHTSEEANFRFSEEEIQQFLDDPEFYHAYRKKIEQELQSFHGITFRGALSQDASASFKKSMAAKLAAKPEILDKLVPDFPPACRRLTPGPGYLTALTKSNVDFITTEIAHVTEEGVVTKDGTTRAVDALICATGFDTTWTGRFPIIGRQGRLLAEKWAEYPKTYIGVTTDEFPNMFMSLGPSTALGTGSLSIVLERIGDYVCAAIQKMQREAIRSIEAKSRAVETFYQYSLDYFADTVFTLPCRSWYKGGTVDGKVSALWPGSSLHCLQVLQHPRWEDYEYEMVHDNDAAWLGDGWTVAERQEGLDRAEYLNPENIDFPPVPEGLLNGHSTATV
ncbi:hypothetical protein CLAIMM_09506 [Cladophialophora immunda]|nr:hypothetical protein CLAIMM_09506 [Cladophialophora immunda]